MFRPPLEVADLIHAAGIALFQRSRPWLSWLHWKVLNAIVRCRTAALGGHVDECARCGHRAISYNHALWGVICNGEWSGKGRAARGVTPLRLSIKTCP